MGFPLGPHPFQACRLAACDLTTSLGDCGVNDAKPVREFFPDVRLISERLFDILASVPEKDVDAAPGSF